MLELRMIEQGFVVKTARSVEQALKILAEGETDLVVSEIDLGPGDGLALLAEARKQPWGKDMPWVIYTRRQERAVAQKAFELGRARLREQARVRRRARRQAQGDARAARERQPARSTRGVSGSLREMGLPDMVQVLFHGRKSGQACRSARRRSRRDPLRRGQRRRRACGATLRGETAFYAMLKLHRRRLRARPVVQAHQPRHRPVGRGAAARGDAAPRRRDLGRAVSQCGLGWHAGRAVNPRSTDCAGREGVRLLFFGVACQPHPPMPPQKKKTAPLPPRAPRGPCLRASEDLARLRSASRGGSAPSRIAS